MSTTTQNLKELLAQREELNKQIDREYKLERAAALGQVLEIVKEHGLTQEDVFGRAIRAVTGNTVPPKYRDPITGATWTGRGKSPLWIAGKDRDAFLIA